METMSQFIQYIDEAYGSQTVFQYCEKKNVYRIRYSEFVRDVKKCAGFLRAEFSDIEGRHIGICAKSSYQYMVHFMAILYVKAIVVPLNPLEAIYVLQYEINDSDIIGLFLDEGARKLELEAHSVRFMTFDEYWSFTGSYEHAEEDRDSEDRIQFLLYTSGTTDRNKGVLLSRNNMFAALKTYTGQLKLFEKNMKGDVLRAFLVVPMYHVSGIVLVLAGISKGITINICGNPKYLYRELQMMKSDCISVVPTILKSFYGDLIRQRKERLGDLSTILCSGAMLGEDMVKAFQKNGIAIMQAYALTESFGNGTLNTYEDENKIKSVGLPGERCEIRIENGEILIRGDSIMQGYYHNEQETKKTLKADWLHTGDMGYLDADGYLYLTGRKKNLIILSGGENVSPEELENKVSKCREVYEVLVKEENDKICALIYCEVSAQSIVKGYISEFNRTLPYYKRITKVLFSNRPLEKTATGKLKR